MIQTHNQSLQQLLECLSINNLYQKILKSQSTSYSIRNLKLQTFSPKVIQQMISKYQSKQKDQGCKNADKYCNSDSQTWVNHQFKVFAWISICSAFLAKRQIYNFKKDDIEYLCRIFSHKSPSFLQYNLRTLSKEVCQQRKKWDDEQIYLLHQIIKQMENAFHWSQISYQLYLRSNSKFYRSPQKCREQWINHLNPHVKKDKWAVNQDILLFRTVLDFGKKWSNISKLFNGSRTEHMVKNRYNSVIHKHQNKSNKVSEKKLCLKILAILEARQGKQDLGLPIKSQERHQTEVNGSIVSNLVQVMEEKQEILEIQNGNNSDAKMLIQTETVVENAKEPTKTENSPDSVAEDLEFGETLLNFEQTLFNIKSLSQSENAIKLQQIQFFQQNRHKSDEQYLFSLLA